MEAEHTKKTLSDHLKDHNPGDIIPNLLEEIYHFICFSLKILSFYGLYHMIEIGTLLQPQNNKIMLR
jgi:hypothetical protein